MAEVYSQDDIIRKIQKLVNLQEGAAAVGNLKEAEAAASRVQALLMQHNLDMEKVQSSTIKKRAEFFNGWVDLSDKQDKRESFWVPKLYGAIARNNLCKASVDNDSIYLIGRKEQVELVLYICEQMIAKVRIAEKYAWEEYDGEEKRGTFRRGFFLGAAMGIDNRLRRDNQETNNPYAVMIVSREDELNTYCKYGTIDPDEIAKILKKREEMERLARERLAMMSPEDKKKLEKQMNKGRKIKWSKGPKQLSSQDGVDLGYRAGSNMSINKGMNNSESKGYL